MRICYINDQFVKEENATISIFDRGFLFSDSIYEVTLVINDKMVHNNAHLDRLKGSLKSLDIALPTSLENIEVIQKELIQKNNLTEGTVYLQVTRGNDGDRNFHITQNTKPTLVLFTQEKNITKNKALTEGINIITLPETRWTKRAIKATSLLGAVLAKKEAKENNVHDAWFVENGLVTEGSSNNLFLIKGKTLITKAPNDQILNGITRQKIIQIANNLQFNIEERDFSVEEALTADEVFVTSASMMVTGVISIDGKTIGSGNIGNYTQQFLKAYLEFCKL